MIEERKHGWTCGPVIRTISCGSCLMSLLPLAPDAHDDCIRAIHRRPYPSSFRIHIFHRHQNIMSTHLSWLGFILCWVPLLCLLAVVRNFPRRLAEGLLGTRRFRCLCCCGHRDEEPIRCCWAVRWLSLLSSSFAVLRNLKVDLRRWCGIARLFRC